ncbi:MAG TPA: substrate-binding domain-containing protein [Thermoguttaceae bacterium]|nr:substrate-binding domain-containing protein [Thermoguttaceae bacterium]
MKNFILFSGLTALLAAATIVQAAEPAASAKPTNDKKPLRLAFITTCKDAVFFETVKKGMHDAAEKMDVQCDWLGTDGVDLPAQADLVRRAVADGYDGIALNLIDPKAFDGVVAEAIQKGVPVVGFNVDDNATPNARLSSVNQRLYEAGKALGRHVAPRIPPGSHVLLTMHDKGVSALEDRRRGIQDALKEKKVRWTILVPGNVSTKGAEAIAKTLRENPDIRAVLCTGQADTEAAGLAVEHEYPDGTRWAAGFDLSPTTLRLVKQGYILATVDQQPYVQGFYPVVQLTLNLRYGIVPTDMDAGAIMVDRSNADRVLELTKQKYR